MTVDNRRPRSRPKPVLWEEEPIPEIGDNEMLIEVEYADVNQTGWKRAFASHHCSSRYRYPPLSLHSRSRRL